MNNNIYLPYMHGNRVKTGFIKHFKVLREQELQNNMPIWYQAEHLWVFFRMTKQVAQSYDKIKNSAEMLKA